MLQLLLDKVCWCVCVLMLTVQRGAGHHASLAALPHHDACHANATD
jgi:hypothetical protein